MRAERLTRAPLEGGRTDEPSLALDERLGVLDDRKSAKDGSVSLLSGEAEETIRAVGGPSCSDHASTTEKDAAFHTSPVVASRATSLSSKAPA